ncbi:MULTISPECIES: DUF4846 domain-containing protein [Filomicrobium]|uniref:DUF4846 domain-containing protein n=1 Tax=Filomicrobium insigne TaxID=418854 RepID=A0A1H0SAR8_9HYPH|nr:MULTISPECIES: DUF4846 domain-containing protein [Filomicrobium]MCV0371140.1 DUF4846 domain-containing protein [Filomicrobium sp.]SDP38853.1 protein of unknown function (4846) [Filomicrobium insigne]
MNRIPRISFTLAGLLFAVMANGLAQAHADTAHPWPTNEVTETLQQRIAPPPGFRRVPLPENSFGDWLRNLPLKPSGSPVLLYTGAHKWRQDVHAAVIDIDVGKRDLQQCADAIMRLRAEWLWATGQKGDIAFNYTGGGRVPFSRWAKGERPSESGKSWRRKAKADSSYASFRRYMIQVFAYAGTYSLERELKAVPRSEIDVGDVFIKGGFPGHAVLVADMVENEATGEKRFLLIQSYMPAQDMHVLVNPADTSSPWYTANVKGPLKTPEWTFPEGSLHRWP